LLPAVRDDAEASAMTYPTHRLDHCLSTRYAYELLAGKGSLVAGAWVNGVPVAYLPTEEEAIADYVSGVCTVEGFEAALDVMYGLKPVTIEYTLRPYEYITARPGLEYPAGDPFQRMGVLG
jgi:hypothetical protein